MEIKSTISLEEFGKAMSAVDFSEIEDPEKRKQAVYERVLTIMEATVTDPAERQKMYENRSKAVSRVFAKGGIIV